MKNKNMLLVIVLIALTAKTSLSQIVSKGWYVKLHAGYSVSSAGGDALLTSPGFLADFDGTLLTLDGNGRTGEGLNLGLGLEKELGKVVIAGIDFNYLSGKAQSATGAILPQNTFTYTYTGTGTHSVVSAVPNLSFKVYNQAAWYLYTKIGAILAFTTKYHTHEVFVETDPTFTGEIYDVTDDYHYGLNIGLQAAIGIQFKLTGNIKGFAEMTNNYLSASPNSDTGLQILSGNSKLKSSNNTYTFNYIKSNSGNGRSSPGAVSTNLTPAAITQHFNSTVLNVGVAFAVK